MSPSAIVWIERAIWILIYSGLFSIILGIASRSSQPTAGVALGVLGTVAVVTGTVLIWVRSRLQESATAAESKSTSEGTRT